MVPMDDIYRVLFEHYGSQHWWPGDSRFEVMVGAVLTQNTNWKNVESALQQLRADNLLSPEAIHQLPPVELAQLIRPAGYYRLKARRLKNLVAYLMAEYDGSIDAMLDREMSALREELLQINGIGPETADSILLYALEKPAFVVDAYTARVVSRHAWLSGDADYHQVQSFFVDGLPLDLSMFNEFHALIVRLGKEYCRKTPLCSGCPLESLLPEGGPCTDGRR